MGSVVVPSAAAAGAVVLDTLTADQLDVACARECRKRDGCVGFNLVNDQCELLAVSCPYTQVRRHRRVELCYISGEPQHADKCGPKYCAFRCSVRAKCRSAVQFGCKSRWRNACSALLNASDTEFANHDIVKLHTDILLFGDVFFRARVSF